MRAPHTLTRRVSFAATILLAAMIATAALADESGSAEEPDAPSELPVYELPVVTAGPIYELDPVVVTAARREQRLADTPVATELIRREELEKSGAVNLAEFLEKQPGIVVTHSVFGSGIQLQGLGSEYVLVLVNGERALGRKGGVLDLSRYAVDNIERIEVVKGNQSSLYGSDAIGGVVNLITRASRAPLELDFHGDLGGGDRLDLGGSLGTRGEIWTTRFTGNWARAEPHDIRPEDPETSVDGYTEFGITNHSEAKLSPKLKAKFRTSYVNLDRQGVDGGITDSAAIFDRSSDVEVFTASLGPSFVFDSGSLLASRFQFSYYRDQYLHDQRGSDALDQYQETLQRLVYGSVQYDHFHSMQQLVSLGVELFTEDIETERLEGGRSDRQRVGVFLQDEWGIDAERRWVLVSGLRYDSDSQFGQHVTPKIALRHDPTERFVLRASVGQGFRAPDFKELYVSFSHPAVGYEVHGNPELEPEITYSASLGVEFRAFEHLWLSATGFHHDFENLIQGVLGAVQDNGLQEASYINVAAARITGFETTLRLQPWPRLGGELSYSFLDTKDETTGSVLDGRPRHRGSLKVETQLPRSGSALVLRASLVGTRTFTQEYSGLETEAADPYALLDLKLTQAIGDLLTLSMGMENLLDAGDHDYLRIAPRRFFTGLDLRYRRAE